MNTTIRNLLLLLTVSIGVGSSVAMAGPGDDELDITMTVMGEDKTPADFVQRIELPPESELGADVRIGNESVADITTESRSMVDEVAETVTGSIKDQIVIGDKEKLPPDIVDNLGDGLPLLGGDGLVDTGGSGSDTVDTVTDSTGGTTDQVSGTTDTATDTVSGTSDTATDTTGTGDLTDTTGTGDTTGDGTVTDTTDSLIKDATNRTTDESKLLP